MVSWQVRGLRALPSRLPSNPGRPVRRARWNLDLDSCSATARKRSPTTFCMGSITYWSKSPSHRRASRQAFGLFGQERAGARIVPVEVLDHDRSFWNQTAFVAQQRNLAQRPHATKADRWASSLKSTISLKRVSFSHKAMRTLWQKEDSGWK